MSTIHQSRHRLHLDMVELGGRSGVFQHSVAVGHLLTSLGATVVLHTANDPESLVTDLPLCTCFSWMRSARARFLRIALWFVARTLPHLLRTSGPVVWVQGTFKPVLTLLLLLGLRLTRRATVFSPHNLFSRGASRVDAWCIARCVRTASHVVVYNLADYDTLRRQRGGVWLLPLLQVAPPVSETALERWRPFVADGVATVCAIGQIREDKNLPLLLEAAARTEVRVLVVGPDAGGLTDARRSAEKLQADALFFDGYHDLEDLAAVLVLTGVVVCPYRIASQSGVARLATAYGAVVVATDVGGLREQADVVIDELTPAGLAKAMQSGLGMRRASASPPVAAWSDGEKRQVEELLEALR